MRVMLDSLYPLDIPLAGSAGTLIASYVNHSENPAAMEQARERFPNNQIVTISSHGADLTQILDVERGALDPTDRADIMSWVMRKRQAGTIPTVYCSTSNISLVRSYFAIQTMPQIWEANWNGKATISNGTVGHQFDGRPGYDISTMLDYVPGIDSPEDDMAGFDILQALQNATVPMTAQGGTKRSLLDILQAAGYAQLAASRAGAIQDLLANPTGLATAIIKQLGPGATVTVQELETALTEVLGSLS